MEDKILNLLRRRNYTPLNAAEMRTKLGLTKPQQKQFEQVLAQMERRGQVARIKEGTRYALPIVEEALALQPRPQVIWMQLGIRNDEAAALALAPVIPAAASTVAS